MTTQTKAVELVFDFGSPNAYLAWQVLKDIAARTGARVEILPALLGGIFKATNNQPPMMAFGPVKGKLAYEMLEMRRFIARHGLSRFAMNPHFPVNTLRIMRGLIVARRAGVETAYVEAMLSAMWERGLKMDDPVSVAAVLAEAGLDPVAFDAGIRDESVKTELLERTDAVVARGVFGIPTFFVDGEMWFGKERLGQVEEALAG